MRFATLSVLCLLLFTTQFVGPSDTWADDTPSNSDYRLDTFETKTVTREYFSEGAASGDMDGDGILDFVYGPHWYAGPSFEEKFELYPAVAQNREGYADHFFAWTYDFDNDGWLDVLTVGFPGTPAYVYKNPGNPRSSKLWAKKQVFDWVSNESPQWVQLVGDERPELVLTRDGFFGYAEVDWERPFEPWKFIAISGQDTDKRFGHGLGVGDINGDGRMDLIHANGWLEQPKSLAPGKRWVAHAVAFSNAYGGAEMFAYDVDGDGDNDVITSLAAHDFGLAWYEQIQEEDGALRFVRHDIMGNKPSDNSYGVVFSELHSLQLADIDGDGLKDIVTGKTFYSHHKASPMWDAGAVVYWFQLVRNADGVDWVPHQIAADCGIGRQIGLSDLNQDGLVDITVGGMKGGSVLIHSRKECTQEDWIAVQPVKRKAEMPTPGSQPAFEGEKLRVVRVSEGTTAEQGMGSFSADRWSGDAQLWWTGGKVGSRLELQFTVSQPGTFDVLLAMTKAIDYGIVQVSIDGTKMGEAIDLFHEPDVVSTGMMKMGAMSFAAGDHTLSIELVGKNPKAAPGYMVGIDALRLGMPVGQLPKSIEGKSLNTNFEKGTLEDWTAMGAAFDKQPIEGDAVAGRRGDMASQHEGKFWIGGFEKLGDQPKGTLTSSPFVVDQPFASYLIGGGGNNEVRVELLEIATNKLIHRTTGRMTENMRLVVVDLASVLGKQCYIRLVDESSNGWGHLNFDAFLLHDVAPAAASPSDSPLVVDEYPFEGLPANEAANAMVVPEGFKVIASASEPDVLQPIAMALDDRGRVWVAEAYEYPRRAAEGAGRDRILIFEDTDGDGVLDKRKVFAEGLNLVSGLEVGFGGAFVGAAPYLMFIPDRDGDDRADGEPEILLDGWGLQDTHETLNAFIWGPDGWLYGCHGVFTYSNVGKPGAADQDRKPINAGVWRYHPTQHVFEVFAHGTSNPWGVDFNDHGQAFITACVIPHLYHIIDGGRYERQAGNHFNPFTYDDIKTIAEHRHYVGANPHAGNGKSDSAGGGHAHAGAMIYLGDAWPQTYRNQLFMNNIHGQRLNVDVLKARGSGYTGNYSPDFLLTGDKASQILNLRYGPDGQAWMIDWYDMQACHLTDPGKHDRSNGRIYKIVYGNSKSKSVDLTKATDRELASHMSHKNDWFVRHSRRILQERAATRKIDRDAVVLLNSMLKEPAPETTRLRAAWALACIQELNDTMFEVLIADSNEYVRGWAIQLGLQSNPRPACVQSERLSRLAKLDRSSVVRLYLASAAQRLPLADRWDLIEALASHPEDAGDHNLPLLIWYAAEPLSEVDPKRAMALALKAADSIPQLRGFMLKRIGASSSPQAVESLVVGLGQASSESDQLAFLDAIRSSLKGKRQAQPPKQWLEVYAKLLNASANVGQQADAIGVTFGSQEALNRVRSLVQSKKQSDDNRLAALGSLLGAKDPMLPDVLFELLSDNGLRGAALGGLAQYAVAGTPKNILKVYASLLANEKRIALDTLASRVEYATELLKAVESKTVSSSDLSADLVRQLGRFQDKEVNALLQKAWGTVSESSADKAKVIEEYKAMIQDKKGVKPDPSLGRAVFAKTCQQCHILFDAGGKIGPELTGSNRTNVDYLLSNIVDPSAVMAKEYQPTLVQTQGRLVSGLLKEEDSNSITLQTTSGLEVIPLDEIEDRKLSEKSMMPEDQLRPFSAHEIRSLVAYLGSDRQLPLLASVDNVSDFFNGKDLSQWSGDRSLWSVQEGELVGQTKGLEHNAFIVSNIAVQDFQLTLEVMLVGNEGNSGIQFRSQKTNDGVMGYQADIGPGWWGKLYEEEGRGLLWDKSAEGVVKTGQWNRYEIRAVGSKIQTSINGELCVDLDDPKGAGRGIIALQLHSGGATEVRFRNMVLTVLPGPKLSDSQLPDPQR